MRDFLRFSRDFGGRVLRHVGTYAVVTMALGVVSFVQRDAFGLAWTAFLIACASALGRASDAAMQEMRARSSRKVERMVREMLEGRE